MVQRARIPMPDTPDKPAPDSPAPDKPAPDSPAPDKPGTSDSAAPDTPAELTPFTGLTLTDTFQMYEWDRDLVAASLFRDNAERRARQRAQDITLIVGNPPYSAGQRHRE